MKKESNLLIPKKVLDELVEEAEKQINSKERLCNSCNLILPETLDRGICPHCGIRN